MCEMTVHAEVFNSRRDHLRAQKASKLLAVGVRTPLGSLHRSPTAGPPKTPPRALSTSDWGEATEGPQVTVEPGPLRALLRHWWVLFQIHTPIGSCNWGNVGRAAGDIWFSVRARLLRSRRRLNGRSVWLGVGWFHRCVTDRPDWPHDWQIWLTNSRF